MEVVTKTCCITGHRDIPAEKKKFVEEELRKEVVAAIEDGYTRFISGFADDGRDKGGTLFTMRDAHVQGREIRLIEI